MGFPIGLAIKNLPAKQEMSVQSLGWEDTLENGMATHSNILAWKNPWTEEPGELQSVHGVAEFDNTEGLTFSLSFHTVSVYCLSLCVK